MSLHGTTFPPALWQKTAQKRERQAITGRRGRFRAHCPRYEPGR